MGLRERKKEKTRLALLDAALELFLEQGYDSTTVDQIAGSVDVSARTFFRYFANKEHLVFWFHDHGEEVMQAVLDERPADEAPFTSLGHALRAVLRDMEDSTPEDGERFLKMHRLLEENPALVGKSVARASETERRLAAAIALRMGVDPAKDQRPQLVVAFAMATLRVGFECHDGPVTDLSEVVRRMEATLDLAEQSFRPGWDLAP